MWHDWQYDNYNSPDVTKMTQKLKTIGHFMAFNNDKIMLPEFRIDRFPPHPHLIAGVCNRNHMVTLAVPQQHIVSDCNTKLYS